MCLFNHTSGGLYSSCPTARNVRVCLSVLALTDKQIQAIYLLSTSYILGMAPGHHQYEQKHATRQSESIKRHIRICYPRNYVHPVITLLGSLLMEQVMEFGICQGIRNSSVTNELGAFIPPCYGLISRSRHLSQSCAPH